MLTCRVCETAFEPYSKGGKKLCKPCYNAYMREYMLARYHRRRDAFIESQGRTCKHCGTTGGVFEIDHTEPELKTFDLGPALASWSERRITEELKKCQILCKPCHAAKTRKDKAARFGQREHWEHGTLGGYRYCRCGLCKAAKSRYNRKYNKTRVRS